MLWERERALRVEMPQPSSRMVDVGERREVVKSGFWGLESHVAKEGVTFHSTEGK